MSETKLVTGRVRFSYAQVFEPRAINPGDTPKYSCSLLIPKTDKETLEKYEVCRAAAEKEGIAKFGAKWKATNPLKDGDIEKPENPEYAGCFFLSANSHTKPFIYNGQKQDITNPVEFYSGCYGHASVNLYPFNAAVNKGIAVGLNAVIKTEDGEALGGTYTSAQAREDFDDVDSIL